MPGEQVERPTRMAGSSLRGKWGQDYGAWGGGVIEQLVVVGEFG